MLRFLLSLFLVGLVWPAVAATPKPAGPEKVTEAQLQQALAASHEKPDADLAQQLAGLELTERLSAARLARLQADLPGEGSRQALSILARQSAFLAPPEDEIVQNPTPDAAATRQMLVQIVNYVNNTVRQLPNLMATRATTAYEDRPQQDLQQETSVVSYSYLPLHFVGRSSVTVTYRDRREVEEQVAAKTAKRGPPIRGLVTTGEFGPILSTALADALKGKITWARWERGADGTDAVFHYAVPDEKSNYHVRFCCIANGFNSDGLPDLQVFDERAPYHGEITFDPADGAIQRITLEAEMPAKELVSQAGILIEYAPVEIGGRSYICPSTSISVLKAHTAQQKGMYARGNYQGMPKTYLNEVVFSQYRRFGSETRILTGENEPPAK